MRRDAEGRRQLGVSWESLVERQIREAMEAGAFDDLPHQGQPLPLENDEAAGDWAMAHRILRSAGAAPAWIVADKEARRLLAEIEALIERAAGGSSRFTRERTRATLTSLVQAANAVILRLNSEAPTARQQRRPVDLAQQIERLERAFVAG